MGKIYTGYFAQTKRYEKMGLTPVSISRWSPKWFTGEECKILAPSVDLLNKYKNGQIDASDYTEEFMQMLNNMDLAKIIQETAHGRDIILLCYEKPGDFCHRHLVAKALNQRYGLKVEEYKI